ncbi:MAG: hypothetical protein ACK5O7_06935 [Holosporales bacterium]
MTKFIPVIAMTTLALGATCAHAAFETDKTKWGKDTAGWVFRGGLNGGYGQTNVHVNKPKTVSKDASHAFMYRARRLSVFRATGALSATYYNGLYMEGRGTLGFVEHGHARYRLYNSRTGVERGHVRGNTNGSYHNTASVAVGYNLMPLINKEISHIMVRPLLGYSYERLNFKLNKEKAHVSGVTGVDPLHTSARYRMNWYGPTAGLGLGMNLDQRHALGLRGHYTYVAHSGKIGRVRLKRSEGHGMTFAGQYGYQLLRQVQLVAGYEWQTLRGGRSKARYNDVSIRSGRHKTTSWTARAGMVYTF